MKQLIAALFVGSLIFLTAQASATVIAGPIHNPTNGHDYYLLAPNTWSACEAEAGRLGGTLAVIKTGAEQKWVFSTFATYGGGERGLWIGLHRTRPGGEFVWVDGTPVDYTNWYPGEPNNVAGRENCAHMRWDPAAPGTWNDLPDDSQLSGVVEVVESSETLRALYPLVGQWYEEGNADRPCFVAASGDAVFAINDCNHFSGRVIGYKDGTLFVAAWQVHGEVMKDKILWSNGTWWSRKPIDFGDHRKMLSGTFTD